jgi:hypothetical protein
MASANPKEPSSSKVSSFQELIDLICKIPSDGTIPVIFVMIGSFPGFSSNHQHERPPILHDIINNSELIHSYVILIDPDYTKKIPINIPPGTWYNDPEYHDKVSFAYFPSLVENNDISRIINVISGKISIAVWSFTGDNFGEINHQNNPHIHIPPGNCLANTTYNGHYHPQIVIEDNRVVFKPITHDLNHSIAMMKNVFKNIVIGKSYDSQKLEVLLAQGFSYYILKDWFERIKIMYSWVFQITTDSDETRRRCLDKFSTENDWAFLDYRIGPYYNSTTLREEFMKSNDNTVINFICNKINQMGCSVIELDNMISLFNNHSITVENDHYLQNVIAISVASFCDQYDSYFIKKNSRIFPQIFENYLTECTKTIPSIGINKLNIIY